MAEKIKFPLQLADRCPHCKNEGRALKKVLDQLKAEGRVSKELFQKGFAIQVSLFDPKKAMTLLSPTVKAPVLTLFFEVCDNEDCGCMYCTGIDVTEQTYQVQMQGPNPQTR